MAAPTAITGTAKDGSPLEVLTELFGVEEELIRLMLLARLQKIPSKNWQWQKLLSKVAL